MLFGNQGYGSSYSLRDGDRLETSVVRAAEKLLVVPIHLGTAIDWKPLEFGLDISLAAVPIHLGTAIDWKQGQRVDPAYREEVPIHLGTAIDWKEYLLL